jgi:hypothetical protein
MSLRVTVHDNATQLLLDAVENFPEANDHALKGVGWYMQQEIKTGIKSGAPGGQPFPAQTMINARLKSSAGKRRAKRGTGNQLGKLYSAVRYKFSAEGYVRIGWITSTAERLGTIQERGATFTITPKMRRMYHAAGVPLGKKSSIVIPRRATIGPEYAENKSQIPREYEKRLWDALGVDD